MGKANRNAYDDSAYVEIPEGSGEWPPAAGRYVRQFGRFPSLEPGAQDYGLFRQQASLHDFHTARASTMQGTTKKTRKRSEKYLKNISRVRIPNPGEWYRKEGTPYILYRPRRGSNYQDKFYKVDDLRNHKRKRRYRELVKGSIISPTGTMRHCVELEQNPVRIDTEMY